MLILLKFRFVCSLFVFKLYHKTCEHFYRNFGLYEKSPNSFLPGLSRSIINQFRFHNLLCLCLASVHLPHPFHLVFSFQLLCHAVLLRQLWHNQLHAVSCRFVNLGAILSYVHPAIAPVRCWRACATEGLRRRRWEERSKNKPPYPCGAAAFAFCSFTDFSWAWRRWNRWCNSPCRPRCG